MTCGFSPLGWIPSLLAIAAVAHGFGVDQRGIPKAGRIRTRATFAVWRAEIDAHLARFITVNVVRAAGRGSVGLGLVCQAESRKDSTQDAAAETPQRRAPAYGSRQALGQFIEFVVHNFLSFVVLRDPPYGQTVDVLRLPASDVGILPLAMGFVAGARGRKAWYAVGRAGFVTDVYKAIATAAR